MNNMCLYPRLIKNRKYTITKKNGGQVPAIPDKRVETVPIGCGNCMECRKKKAREWQVRLLEDIRHNKNAIFITLTLSNEEITKLYNDEKVKNYNGYEKDNKAATLAVRRFNERWRKKYKKAIRHWLVTELGHNGTENIHIHGLIWTDKTLKEIENIWQYGWTWAGTYVNEQTINYITKYINKKDEQHKTYKSKIMTSAGIGSGYVERKDANNNKYNNENTKEYYTTRTGHKITLPIYWRNKIYTEEEKEKLWINKLNKEIRYINGKKIDISNGDCEYNEHLKAAQEQNIRLGYGTGKEEWSVAKYEEQRRTLLQKKRAKGS